MVQKAIQFEFLPGQMVVTKITKANKKYLAINFTIEKENDSDVISSKSTSLFLRIESHMSSYIVLQTRAIGPCKEGNLPIMGCHVILCNLPHILLSLRQSINNTTNCLFYLINLRHATTFFPANLLLFHFSI